MISSMTWLLGLLLCVAMVISGQKQGDLWLPIDPEAEQRNSLDSLDNDMVFEVDGASKRGESCKKRKQDLDERYKRESEALESECSGNMHDAFLDSQQQQQQQQQPPRDTPENWFPFSTFPPPQNDEPQDASSKVELLPMDSSSISACLANTNKYRHYHEDASDIVWDAELAEHAGKWAKHLMELAFKNGQLELVHHRDTKKEGENLFWSVSTANCQRANEAWYLEHEDYDFSRRAPKTGWSKQSVGDFTQLVSKNTRRFGVGVARGNFGKYWEKFRLPQYIVVARYSPAGDDVGNYVDHGQPIDM